MDDVKTEKIKNLHFIGAKIQAWSIVPPSPSSMLLSKLCPWEASHLYIYLLPVYG